MGQRRHAGEGKLSGKSPAGAVGKAGGVEVCGPQTATGAEGIWHDDVIVPPPDTLGPSNRCVTRAKQKQAARV